MTQFHDIAGKGETHKPSPPPIALVMVKNKLRIVIFNRIEWTTFNAGECDIEVGKWYEFLWHIKWSMGEDCFVEVFSNGENITNGKYYTPTLFHFTGNTVKFSIYNNETVTYCSKFAIGNTPKEVNSEYM
ncbi:MAG: heparin lyase I family protein [Terrisporobacter sp.]